MGNGPVVDEVGVPHRRLDGRRPQTLCPRPVRLTQARRGQHRDRERHPSDYPFRSIHWRLPSLRCRNRANRLTDGGRGRVPKQVSAPVRQFDGESPRTRVWMGVTGGSDPAECGSGWPASRRQIREPAGGWHPSCEGVDDMRKVLGVGAAVVATFLIGAASVSAQVMVFTATLGGGEETPALLTGAGGTAEVAIDPVAKELAITLRIFNVPTNTT